MSESSTARHATSQPAIADAITAFGPWFHNLHLPDGTQTAPQHPLGDFPTYQWQQLRDHIPQDLSGWKVLDIGCNAGFYSFELAKRGGQVIGIDSDQRYIDQANWAARQYGLEERVNFRQMQVYDLAHSNERFDLVLFLNVIYHLRYPTLALDIVAQRVARLLIFQPLILSGKVTGASDATPHLQTPDPGQSKRSLREDLSVVGQPHGGIPNPAGVEALLHASGLQIAQTLAGEIYLCAPALER